MSVKVVSIPVPTMEPLGVHTTLLAMKQAIEQLAAASVTTDELVRLRLVTSQMIASSTGRVTK